jgi:hypothetical protein
MDEDFTIPVTYKNEERNFTARLLNYGYSYKIEVEINGAKILFEPDEERKWRAMIAYEEIEANKNIDKNLLSAIASTIEKITG